jgi:hypothetical protein
MKKTRKKHSGGSRSRSRSRSRSPPKDKEKSPPKDKEKSPSKSPPKPINIFKFKSFMQKSDFEDLPNPNEFEQIYIGIGAKFYKSNYPIGENTGAFQLYPNFVDSEKSTLIIIIDPQLDMEVETQRYVESSILRNRDVFLHNTTYVMIKAPFNKTMFAKMISYLEQKPSVDNLWICSFVSFMSPNGIEKGIENIIDAFFENKVMPYKNNSYKWLGYKQPYILRKYSSPEIIFDMAIRHYRARSTITKPRPIDPDKYLNFCYDADFEESTKQLL